MAYREACVPYNLRSAVQETCDFYDHLAWDADHEAVYGRGYFDAERCKDAVKRYRQVVHVCYDYLNSKICKPCLDRRLEKIDCECDDIKKFLHYTNDEKCDFCQ